MPVEAAAAAAAAEVANTSFGEKGIEINSGLAAGLGTTCNGPMIMIASYRVRTLFATSMLPVFRNAPIHRTNRREERRGEEMT